MTTEDGFHGRASAGVFRSILVGYDGSSEARYALVIAKYLAAQVRGTIHVLQVVRPSAHGETTEDLAEAARAELDRLSQGLEAATLITSVVISDSPGEAISHFATEHGVDLIVTGGHGREQSVHRGMGHTLEALLRERACPVLVV